MATQSCAAGASTANFPKAHGIPASASRLNRSSAIAHFPRPGAARHTAHSSTYWTPQSKSAVWA
eukprot:486954-Pyramimonas_sp.AAC.1